jgi:hypothetical protein
MCDWQDEWDGHDSQGAAASSPGSFDWFNMQIMNA